MFQVRTPVFVVPTAEAREVLGAELRPASIKAWLEIARCGQGLELANLQFVHKQIRLSLSSRVKKNGAIEISLGLDDLATCHRAIPIKELYKASRR